MSLYKQKNSQVWWVNIRHAGRRVRRSTGETDRSAAQRIHNAIQVELWAAVPNTPHATWGQAVGLWLDAEERSDSELLSLKKFGLGYPDRPLTDVTGESLEQALKFCKTAGTYTRYRTMLMAILNLTKKRGWLSEVPRMATRTDKKRKPRDWITPEQWVKLRLELPRHLKAAAMFALGTGLRQANVLGLTWDRVDLARRLVWIEAEDTKGNKALAVPLSRRARRVLQVQARCREGSEFVFTYRGRPFAEVKTAFQAACCRAGTGRTGSDGKYVGFSWHGFRHTWATWHVQNGTPLDVLQKLGGWSDLRMVMNYAQHSAGYLASYADNNARKKR